MLPSDLNPKSSGVNVYPNYAVPQAKALEFKEILKSLGADLYDLSLPETHALPSLIQPGEKMVGIVYGRYKRKGRAGGELGRGVLVATDQRVLLLDKKPFFIRSDELNYMAVGGVSYSKAGPAGTVTLHTQSGDILVRTFNHTCARNFVSAIESNVIAEREAHESY